jgi:hypothetical protein
MVPPAPWYPLSANVITAASVRATIRPRSRAAVSSWVAPGSAAEAQTRRVGQDLYVHAVSFVFPGVVRLLVGDPVDRDERPVEDRVGQPGGAAGGGLQVIGVGGEQADRFANVAPRGGGADGESAGHPGEGVAVAEMRQGQQGLTARIQAPPSAADPGAMAADQVSEVVERAVDNGIEAG